VVAEVAGAAADVPVVAGAAAVVAEVLAGAAVGVALLPVQPKGAIQVRISVSNTTMAMVCFNVFLILQQSSLFSFWDALTLDALHFVSITIVHIINTP
jgi:hypothetical protein